MDVKYSSVFHEHLLKFLVAISCILQPKHDSTAEHIRCTCNHTTLFSGGFAVQPNKIDFAFVFANLDFSSNPTLYVTQIVIFIVFLLAVIWARRKDTKDIEKV